jgi:hypothetical protein
MRPAFLITLGLLLAGLGGCVYWSYKPVWQFDHLEQNARRVVTGAELQAWATGLLDQYPTMQSNHVWVSQLRTNYPQQLRGLAPKLGPFVIIQADDTNQPPYVALMWSSGFLGACGFYVGRTNFTMDASIGRAWQPGVYFFRR